MVLEWHINNAIKYYEVHLNNPNTTVQNTQYIS